MDDRTFERKLMRKFIFGLVAACLSTTPCAAFDPPFIWVGTYDLIVKPAEVTPSTKFIAFTGSFTNFVGVKGCTVTVRGAASRFP
jgi:hypothetical protein